MRWLGPSTIVFFGLVSLVRCSSEDVQADYPSTASGGASASPVNLTSMGSSFGYLPENVTITPGTHGSCEITVGGEACGGVGYETENGPLDIYIMMDQTGSMCNCADPQTPGTSCPAPGSGCKLTRIDGIRAAMSQFLSDPDSAGIRVGLGYFGQLPLGQVSCDPATYARAAVEMDLLPDHGSAIMSSLDSLVPTGETPTAAALRGACSYARGWQEKNPSHRVVILLLTDGLPQAPVSCATGTGPCCPTLEDAVSAAEECRTGSPGIRTYVLGVGPYLSNLEQIAVAGGSNQAYLVDGTNVSGDVLAALNRIRAAASIPCAIKLPKTTEGATPALNKVNIVYANSSCQGTIFYHLENAEACTDQGGWYYDDPVAPETIRLCPTSCDLVSAPVGTLMVTVGCQSVSSVE